MNILLGKLILGTVSVLCVLSFYQGAVAQPAEGAAIAAIDEPAEGVGGAAVGHVKSGSGQSRSSTGKRTAVRTSKTGTATTASKTTASRTAAPKPKPMKWDGFVIGDKYTFMNFEVVSAAKPYHTRAAKAGGAAGLVQVEILIDTNGNVLTAHARTGNKLLHPEAERAALESKFNRPVVYGKPARAIGFLVYRFGAAEEEEEE